MRSSEVTREWQNISALTDTQSLDTNQVRTVFSSMKMIIGIMTGDGSKHAGAWNSSSRVVSSGMEIGPVVIFKQTQKGKREISLLFQLFLDAWQHH